MTPDSTPAGQAVRRAFDFALTEAGFERDGLNWTWSSQGTFVAVTCHLDTGDAETSLSVRVGWRFDSFGDPEPDPPTAHGCVRSLALNEIAGTAVTTKVSGDSSVAELEQQLATVVRKHVLRWVESWKRPDGFRDYLSDRGLHLAAAWASVLLRHQERAQIELVQAGHLYLQPLDEEFDRQRADLDEAMSAAWAAGNGLASYLATADEPTQAAFVSERGESARRKVMEPVVEHQRMQRRHDAYARTAMACLGPN